MATSAKRRAAYQAAGTWNGGAGATGVAPTGAAIVYAGGRSHPVSGKTSGDEAAAATDQQYIVYAVVAVALIGGALLLIHAWKS